MNSIVAFIVLTVALAGCVVWNIYLVRRHRVYRSGSVVDPDLEARLERLLTEIHRTTSANVELLEDRIDALREVGVLTDERLKRIRASLTDLETVLSRVHRVKKGLDTPLPEPGDDDLPLAAEARSAPETASAVPVSAPAGRQTDAVLSLHRRGLTEREIAQRLDIGIAQVRILLRLSDAGRAPGSSEAGKKG